MARPLYYLFLIIGSALQAEVGSTVTATVINLLKNMVGAGLLNVCVAFQYASVMGGLLVMLFSAFVCTGGPLKTSSNNLRF